MKTRLLLIALLPLLTKAQNLECPGAEEIYSRITSQAEYIFGEVCPQEATDSTLSGCINDFLSLPPAGCRRRIEVNKTGNIVDISISLSLRVALPAQSIQSMRRALSCFIEGERAPEACMDILPECVVESVRQGTQHCLDPVDEHRYGGSGWK